MARAPRRLNAVTLTAFRHPVVVTSRHAECRFHSLNGNMARFFNILCFNTIFSDSIGTSCAT